jgi:hydantoinase/carbamoylase family amidase
VRIVVFAGEEGARFGEPCVGSKAVAGQLADRDLGRMRDAQGCRWPTRCGPRLIRAPPRRHWQPSDWAAFLELHIERPDARASDTPIRLVDTVSGARACGSSSGAAPTHSGGTPMSMRADALTAAAEVVLAAESAAREPRNRGARLTVGRLDVHPNSITTIPGRVRLTLDVRDVDSDRQRRLAVEMVRRARVLCERRGVSVDAELIADTSPSVLPMWIRELTSQVCQELGIRYRVMTSGAGHDSGRQRDRAGRDGVRARQGRPEPRPGGMDERVGRHAASTCSTSQCNGWTPCSRRFDQRAVGRRPDDRRRPLGRFALARLPDDGPLAPPAARTCLRHRSCATCGSGRSTGS